MKTLILPGYSLTNRDWAEQTAKEISVVSPEVIYWRHWETGAVKDGWKEEVAEEIVARDENINILAKSVGTMVAMEILKTHSALVNRLILCGIPINGFLVGDDEKFRVLSRYPEQSLIIFQNENDNLGSFADVERFIHSINLNIEVVSRPRSDHDYPYASEFKAFLLK